MKSPSRPALLILFPIVVTIGCNKASGDRSSPDELLIPIGQETSSLDNRPLVILGFMQPVGAVVTTTAHQSLMDYLTAQTPYRFRVLFSTESERAVGVLEERLVEVAHLGVVTYLEAHIQLGAVPLVKPLNREGEPVSRSVFVVRRGSPLRNLVDLKGRSLALGSFHSTWSNLIPRYELFRAGVSLEDLENLEHFDDDETVAAAVLEGRFDAGAVEDVVAYRHGEKLESLHDSDPLPSAPLVIRDDLPPRVFQTVRDALLSLDFHEAEERQHWDENVRYGFAPAADSDYDPVREIVTRLSGSCAVGCHSSVELGAASLSGHSRSN